MTKFCFAQLYDPNNKAAEHARGEVPCFSIYNYYYHDIITSNGGTFDRRDVSLPHFQTWAEGVGDFYVATDVNSLSITETDRKAGQYFSPPQTYKQHMKNLKKKKNKNGRNYIDPWKCFKTGAEAPGNIGGYHKAVIDTKQPGTHWILSANMTFFNFMGKDMSGPSFIALSRVDYDGFVSSPIPKYDQCRGHLMLKEFKSLSSGQFLLDDVCKDGDALLEALSKNLEDGPASGEVRVPMDGYYPINLHYDVDGKINLIMIKVWHFASRAQNCGVPKKGHICPYQPKLKRRPEELPSEMNGILTQVEIDEHLRRLNKEIQRFPELYITDPND